jgi:type II secretory ATPase GspE/PulE/Tfp pilus assembly ATPase PilB-like protein
VLSTLHTTDAQETVSRIIDFFPPYEQKQIRLSLAGALRGIVCQRLVPRADGTGAASRSRSASTPAGSRTRSSSRTGRRRSPSSSPTAASTACRRSTATC